jgi:pimeloyl-ACP methyl ester carboxylesterase
MSPKPKTVVLIHGLWLTPRSWEPFRGYFEQRGYDVLAPAWPRMAGDVEDLRRDSSALDHLGVVEIADHYERILRTLDERPILIGQSFGGIFVQIVLDRGLGAAGVAIDSVAPQGVLGLPISALKSSSPVLRNPANFNRTVALTFPQFQYGFANNMTEPKARAAYDRYAVPGPGRPVFQVAFSNLTPNAATKVNFRNDRRAPLLLIAGSEDNQIPASMTRENFRRYAQSAAATDYKEFPQRSHLITIQEGWEEVAEYSRSWAEAQAVGGRDWEMEDRRVLAGVGA